MTTTGWAASGEIDLMEIVGEKPHEVLSSLHFGSTFPKRSLITTTYPLPGGSIHRAGHKPLPQGTLARNSTRP